MKTKSLIQLLLTVQIIAIYLAIYVLAGCLTLGLTLFSHALFYVLFTTRPRTNVTMDMEMAKAIAVWYFGYMRKIKHPRSIFPTTS